MIKLGLKKLDNIMLRRMLYYQSAYEDSYVLNFSGYIHGILVEYNSRKFTIKCTPLSEYQRKEKNIYDKILAGTAKISELDNPDIIKKYGTAIACHGIHKTLAPIEKQLREIKFLNKINKDSLILDKKTYKFRTRK